MAIFRLIRWQNLLIIFLTQLFVWIFVVLPVARLSAHPFLLTLENFLLLAGSTVFIAAGGYIINDYFDVRIDNINKPEKMVLEKQIPRRRAIIFHSLVNLLALMMAARVAQRAGNLWWVSLQISCTLILWFYSTHFKRQFITGNVVVALLTALTILTLLLFEPGLHHFLIRPAFVTIGDHILPNPVWVLAIYAFFAFVLTWMREIVKDMEDFKGDEAEGCVTMPIKMGLRSAVRFTELLGVIALLPLLIAAFTLAARGNYLLGAYVLIGLIIPLTFWLFFLPRKSTTTHYAAASKRLKWIMVSGIGSLLVFYLEANG